MNKDCGECDGTGLAMPEGCELCDSYGWVDDPSDGGTMTCPDCNGLAGENCENPECEGGQIYEVLEVDDE